MKNYTSAAPMSAAPRPARSTPWTERLMLRILGLPTEEQAERILRNRPGFFSSLTPKQRALLQTWEGPDPGVLGPANGPKRKF